MISERNTKKEILEAYAVLQEANAELVARTTDKKEQHENFPEKISVVIPFVAEFAQGNELQLALRSWAEYFKEDFNLVIVGDRLPWMAEDLTVIDAPRVSDNPPLDIVHKMQKVIENAQFTEKFIWANDDQYLISPCHTADFEALKCVGKLENADSGSIQYRRNKEHTLKLLQNAGCGTWDFSTHTPVVYRKSLLKNLIENSFYDVQKTAALIASLYFNVFFPGFVPYNVSSRMALLKDNFRLGVFRREANLKLMQELMPGKKLICNSELGWTPALETILNSVFSEKCRFEK